MKNTTRKQPFVFEDNFLKTLQLSIYYTYIKNFVFLN